MGGSKVKPRRFPLVPASNRLLQPGDFWAVPLRDGSYACGRVIDLPQAEGAGTRSLFLGALLDWHGSAAPTSDDIAGAGTLDQGQLHVKAIRETGGAVLGNRLLSLDGIEPWIFMDSTYPTNASILTGLKLLRAARSDDFEKWPILETWALLVIKHKAEDHFLRRSTITGRTGAEEFAERKQRE